MNDDIAIVGIGDLPVGRHPGHTEKELAVLAIKKALDDAGIKKNDIDGLYAVGKGARSETLFSAALAEQLRIEPKSMEETTCGATGGGLALKHAVQEIRSGGVHFALCFASERESHQKTGEWTRVIEATFGDDLPFGPTIPAYYAMVAQRYMHEYGARQEHLAMVAVKNRGHASRYPPAMFKKPITIDDVLSSRMISTPLHLLDCAPRADGAAALILASRERAKMPKGRAVSIAGLGEQHDSSNFMFEKKPITTFPSVSAAAHRAYEASGIGPREIDLAEIYEPFSVCEIILSEDLGFFPKGKGFLALEQGETGRDGRIPTNLSGGRLSLGHPAYCTFFYMLTHLVRQLRGEAGEAQLLEAEVGLAQCEHGMNNGAMVCILKKVDDFPGV